LPKEKKTAEQTPPEAIRPRYPAIEKLIDTEDFDLINKNYGRAYEELEKFSKQKGLGTASNAKKAMKALEKVMDLLKYLLKLKYQYMAAQEKSGEESPQKKVSGDTQLQGNRVR
jgi:hypothetical protein